MGIINTKKGLEEGNVTKSSNSNKRAEPGREGQCFPALKGAVSKRLLLFGVSRCEGPRSLHSTPTVAAAVGHCYCCFWYHCCHYYMLTLSSMLLPPDMSSEAKSRKSISSFAFQPSSLPSVPSIGRTYKKPADRVPGKCSFCYFSLFTAYTNAQHVGNEVLEQNYWPYKTYKQNHTELKY